MIKRLWHGWTTPENASAYQDLLTNEIVPEIESRRIKGFRKMQMMRRDLGNEVEFATLMWWDSADAIREFVGRDIERAHMPSAARAILSRWDERVAQYEIFDDKEQR